MLKISVKSPKGGVGKTTIACNLAGAFAAAGKRVLVVDLDLQQSTFQVFAHKGQIFDVRTAEPRDASEYDVVIYDHHPSHRDLKMAPIVVCPLVPSRLDVESWLKARHQYKGAKVIMVASAVDYKLRSHRKLADHMAKSLDAFVIRRRPSYLEASDEGQTVFSYDGMNAAKLEMEALRDLVESLA